MKNSRKMQRMIEIQVTRSVLAETGSLASIIGRDRPTPLGRPIVIPLSSTPKPPQES